MEKKSEGNWREIQSDYSQRECTEYWELERDTVRLQSEREYRVQGIEERDTIERDRVEITRNYTEIL